MNEDYQEKVFGYHLVLGILCVSKVKEGVSPSFRAPNSDSTFWLEGPVFIHGPSRTVMAFVSPHPTYTCGVNFHYNDGIMIFGMGLHSIFPPFWNHLE